MAVLYDELNLKSNGGTELVMRGMESVVNSDIIDRVYISRSLDMLSRVPKDKPRVFWTHEVAPSHTTDRFETYHMAQNRWAAFDRIVFVSNWQMLDYLKTFNFQWSEWNKVCVIHNAIYPIEQHSKPTDKIRLIYSSNPRRGLNILFKAFEKIAKNHSDVELEVFSSSRLYNVPNQTDDEFSDLFKQIQDHPKIVYHGSQSNQLVREGLKRSHIFAYPSTWGETSCLCLIEAMSAGLLCVHPNQAALFETASNWTNMYHYEPNQEIHVEKFTQYLESAIRQYKDGDVKHLHLQSLYANHAHGWNRISKEWETFLTNTIKNEPC